MDSLNELAYPAEVAGLNYAVSASAVGISVHVSGYSHKLMDLLDAIIHAIVRFEMNEERFLIVHEQVVVADVYPMFSCC